jgi:hypothetical protein
MVNAWGLLGSLLNGTLDEDYPIMTKEGVDGHGDVRETVGVRTDQEFWEEDGHSVVGNPYPAAASPDTITFSSDGVGAAQPVDYNYYGEDHISFGSTASAKDVFLAGTDPYPTLSSFRSAEEGEKWVADHGGYEYTPETGRPNIGIDTSNYEPEMADVDDQRAHHFGTPEVFGNQYTMDQLEKDKKYQDAMMPGIDEENRKYIYESPDGGKTVYRRLPGQDPMDRELVPQKDTQAGVRAHSLADADMRDHVSGTEYKTHFFKYNEDKTLREVKDYVSGTYKSHYANDGQTQTLDLIDSIGDAEAFSKANAIKYLSRFGKKDGKSKFDILKAIHYCILLYHFAGLHNENETPYETF